MNKFLLNEWLPNLHFTLAGLVIILFQACANIVSPTGGAKDVSPPKMIKANPPNESVNFNAEKISITFDEFIQLRDLYAQLMISPPLTGMPDVKVRDRNLNIILHDSLKPNTTYSLNFGDAISDITESNRLKNFVYVFSTGAFLDSMQVRGKVIMAESSEPEKEVLVMLYSADSPDSIPMKERPLYATRTNDKGGFQFKNLSNGPFKVFALKDANSNYLYDLPNELIAFSNHEIFPYFPAMRDSAEADSISMPEDPFLPLFIFQEEDSVQKILRAGLTEYKRFSISFRYPVKEPVFISIEGNRDTLFFIKESNARGDTLTLWLDEQTGDSLKAFVYDGTIFIDTVMATAEYRPRRGVSGFRDMTHLPVTTKNGSVPLDYFEPLVLRVPRPLDSVNYGLFFLTSLHDSISDTIPQSAFTLNRQDMKTINLIYDWQQDKKYTLYILPGAMTDLYGLSNDTLTFSFQTTGIASYGTLQLSVQPPDSSKQYVLEFIRGEREVFKTFIFSRAFTETINHIPTGKYFFRCIEDMNGSGKWDSGNYMKGIQPERTTIPVKDIQINQNWELELEIDINFNFSG